MSTAYVNGRFVPLAEATLALDDPGVLWGAIVTDRLRTFGGRPFRLDDHLTRFRESCRRARVPLTATDDQLGEATARLMEMNYTDADLSLVFLATPGPTLVLQTLPLPWDRIDRLHREGAALVPVFSTLGVDPNIKHRSRLPWWIATADVRETDPRAEPLFLDPASGSVLETATANILAVLDGVVTSPPSHTILPGISLRVTEELCVLLGVPFAERPFTVSDLGAATEIMLSNSTVCLAPVASVGDRGYSHPGPVLQKLWAAWGRRTGVGIGPGGPPAS